jgi:hypothetical protein
MRITFQSGGRRLESEQRIAVAGQRHLERAGATAGGQEAFHAAVKLIADSATSSSRSPDQANLAAESGLISSLIHLHALGSIGGYGSPLSTANDQYGRAQTAIPAPEKRKVGSSKPVRD